MVLHDGSHDLRTIKDDTTVDSVLPGKTLLSPRSPKSCQVTCFTGCTLLLPALLQIDGADRMDVVCVVNNSEHSEQESIEERAIFCTEITGFVKFKVSHSNADNSIKVYNNNNLCDSLQCFYYYDRKLLLFLIDKKKGVFSSEPNSFVLNQMHLAFGCNDIRFYCSLTKESVHLKFWLYGIDDRLVVSDIDGTITRSDVTGYIETVLLKRYEYIHEGVVPFFNDLADTYNLKFVYLTSRPKSHYKATSLLLEKAFNNSSDATGRLPGGPLCMNNESTLRASYREITRNTLVLKSRILRGINEVFLKARSCFAKSTVESMAVEANYIPFIYGFGNRVNDAKAYAEAGLSSGNIFLINTTSKIKIYSRYNTISPGRYSYAPGRYSNPYFDSYSDERLHKYITDNIGRDLNNYTN